MQKLTFSELTRSVGDVDPIYLCKVNKITFSGQIVTDSANPDSPVLAHDTSYLGPVGWKFSAPVSHLDFTVGYFDTAHSTKIRIYDSHGTLLQKVDNTGTGIEHFSFDFADIARVDIRSESDESNGFAVDSVRFVNQAPQVALSGDRDVDGILWGFKWDHTNLTYSFPTASDEYLRNGYKTIVDFAALSATQHDAYGAILQNYGGVCGLSFTETSGANADVRFGQAKKIDYWGDTNLHKPGLGEGTAEALAPDPDHATVSWGDVWFSTNAGGNDNSNPILGNFTYAAAFMHELGHALGLKHGHAEQDAHGVTFPKLPADHDSQEYSIMTYSNYPGHQTNTKEYPSTLMMDDIGALQYLYGADYTYRTGNTTYRWSPTTGAQFVDGVSQGATFHHKIFMTVWDGGGTDTYDFSLWTTAVTLDLEPGKWSTVAEAQLCDLGDGHFARGNIANSLLFGGDVASLIENALGGAGNDTLRGNQAGNLLKGDIGKDHLYALAGNDELDGGGGADFLDGGQGTDVFDYKAAAASKGTNFDTIDHFDTADDVLSLWFAVTKVEKEITNLGLGGTNFVADMETAGANLGIHRAVLFTPNSGPYVGSSFLMVDANGVKGYQSGPDLLIEFDHMGHRDQFGISDFI